MKQRSKLAAQFLALAFCAGFAGAAQAQAAHTWSVKVGVNQARPHVESGDISAPALPGTKTDVGKDTRPMALFTYAYTDNIAFETGIGIPYKHELYGAGAVAGTGTLGTVRVLPVSLFAQYRFFAPTARVRPYVGLGGIYAMFMRETGSGRLTALLNTGGPASTFEVKDKFGFTSQLGVSVSLTDRWFVDAAVLKTYLKTTATFSTGQTLDLKLDPVSVNVGIGYRF